MTEWCPSCGDVKACFHRPNDVIRNAWWAEMGKYVSEDDED